MAVAAKAAKHQHKPEAARLKWPLRAIVSAYRLVCLASRLQLIGVLKVALGHQKSGRPNQKWKGEDQKNTSFTRQRFGVIRKQSKLKLTISKKLYARQTPPQLMFVNPNKENKLRW
jgi:hypothetical protein